MRKILKIIKIQKIENIIKITTHPESKPVQKYRDLLKSAAIMEMVRRLMCFWE